MHPIIENTIHCIGNLYLLQLNVQPKGSYWNYWNSPERPEAPAELNFDEVIEAIKNEGFEPANSEDISIFFWNSVSKDREIIALGDQFFVEDKVAYRVLSIDPSKEGETCRREASSTLYLSSPKYISYLVKKN